MSHENQLHSKLKTLKKLSLIGISIGVVLISCNKNDDDTLIKEEGPITESAATKPIYGTNGLEGYIGYGLDINDGGSQYEYGFSFYVSAWKLLNEEVIDLQIGLPGTWLIPDNTDNPGIALCPPGTLAREWPERGPTWGDVFQTIEGGLGYWSGNRFRYGAPKFSMNGVPSCYDVEIASPGWSFFYEDKGLEDTILGIAQLHNQLLIPPDGITFDKNTNGEFMGYGFMALPLTEGYQYSGISVGNQSWTCFVNTANFKGPIAYYLPETWSKLSKSYPAINGKGLDSRSGEFGGGATEINTVPHFEARASDGTRYTKIPALQFPVDQNGKAVLVREVHHYSKEALYNDILSWKTSSNAIPLGQFAASGLEKPGLYADPSPSFEQLDLPITGIYDILEPFTENSAFGIQWKNTKFETGAFPRYFRESSGAMIPVTEEEVPDETQLKTQKFRTQNDIGSQEGYTITMQGAWSSPGPVAGPFTRTIADGSTVTYYWYRFIDQPVFQQYAWTLEKKEALQGMIEQIHENWTKDKSYIPELTEGNLVALDDNLIVTPPAGMEKGYVPIVVRQE